MDLKQVYLYTCMYENTYSIVIVAEDSYDAREQFKEWLRGREKKELHPSRMRVTRIKRKDERPIFTSV
jgi:hypothetical protein